MQSKDFNYKKRKTMGLLNKSLILIVLSIFVSLVTIQITLAYPLPTAVIGEFEGDGFEYAYVYVTAYDQDNGETLYYDSLQTNSKGQFVDVISLDSGKTFKIVVQVQYFPTNGDSSVITFTYNDVKSGEDQYINYQADSQESSSSGSSGSSSGGGSGTSSSSGGTTTPTSNVVGSAIEVPETSEIEETSFESSPLTEEKEEEEMQKLIESYSKSETDTDYGGNLEIFDEGALGELTNKIKNLAAPLFKSDVVSLMLVLSMIVIFVTILILIIMPERDEDEDEDEIDKNIQNLFNNVEDHGKRILNLKDSDDGQDEILNVQRERKINNLENEDTKGDFVFFRRKK